jgi:short-subunit dehydrogenase
LRWSPGASRGIGASIATELAREGVHVCLAARDKAKLGCVIDINGGATQSL